MPDMLETLEPDTQDVAGSPSVADVAAAVAALLSHQSNPDVILQMAAATIKANRTTLMQTPDPAAKPPATVSFSAETPSASGSAEKPSGSGSAEKPSASGTAEKPPVTPRLESRASAARPAPSTAASTAKSPTTPPAVKPLAQPSRSEQSEQNEQNERSEQNERTERFKPRADPPMPLSTEKSPGLPLITTESIPAELQSHADSATIHNILKTNPDPSGELWRHRYFYTEELAKQHGLGEGHPRVVREVKNSLIEFKVPKSLYSENHEEMAAAWDRFRPAFSNEILQALEVGVEWPDLLRRLLIPLSKEDGGHPRLAQYVKHAVRDPVLTRYPLLHADVLIWTLDESFGSGTAYAHDSLSADWDRTVSRRCGEDTVTLARRVVDAFVKQINEPAVTATTVWEKTSYASQINERYAACLLNDEGCASRGERNELIFYRHWAVARTRLSLREVPIEHTTCGYIARVYISTSECAEALCGIAPSGELAVEADEAGDDRRPPGRGARARRNARRLGLQPTG